MEMNGITYHMMLVYLAVHRHGGWLTNKQIAQLANVSGRTARGHARKLTEGGVFDVATLFPGYRYRVTENPNAEMVQQLAAAQAVFGL